MSKLERQQSLLIAKRERIFASVQRSQDAFKMLQVADITRYKPRYDKLDNLEFEFDTVLNDILALNSQLDEGVSALPVDSVQASFEELLYVAQSYYLTLVERNSATTQEQVPVHTPPVVAQVNTLLTIKLQLFAGDIAQWPDFYDLFCSLVHHNASLNNVQRFHYLRSSLKDAALSTISCFQISSDNYPLAYNALVSRYQNKRLLAALYIQQVLDFNPMKSSNHAKLQHFLQVHRNSVDALKALEIRDLADFLLLSLTLSNLDPQTRKSFEAKHAASSIPTYQQLITFLDEASRTMELCCFDQPGFSSVKAQCAVQSSRRINSLFVANANSRESSEYKSSLSSPRKLSPSCPLCKGGHSLYKCTTFLQQPLPEKYTTLKRLRRCFSCMGLHAQSECQSQRSCWTCRSTHHHSSLHPGSASPPSVNTPVNISTQPADTVVARTLSCHLKSTPSTQQVALLGTVRALIRDAEGQYQPIRAVIDSGSQVSAISRSLAQGLGLKMDPSHTQLSGIGPVITKVHGKVHCDIASRLTPNLHISIAALVLSAISDRLPTN